MMRSITPIADAIVENRPSPQNLARAEKKEATQAKTIKQKTKSISIAVDNDLAIDSVDHLIAELDDCNTDGEYKRVIRQWKISNPSLISKITNSVDLMARVPPKPSESYSMYSLVGEDEPADDRLVIATTRKG